MITEDYVSFETAKLLKEKGFNEYCKSVYHVGSVCSVASLGYHDNEGYGAVIDEKQNSDFGKYDNAISAPTLQMAIKWLREIHHLFIGCEPRLSFTDFYWITANIYRIRKKSSLYHAEDVDDYHCVACCDSHSYEGACEAAIKYSLVNLI